MSIHFSKYEGAGNDFILMDNRSNHFPVNDISLIQRMCHRRFGIGADGLILVCPGLRMRIFNSDGSEAEACGNGLRCFTLFLSDLALTEKIQDDWISVEMGEVKRLSSFRIDDLDVHWIHAGVPHVVCFVPNVHEVSLDKLGPFLRSHPLFMPEGANVNVASRRQDGSVEIRTYERGVEGETLACGTGATAVATLGKELFGWESPVSICAKGGELVVSFDEQLKNVRLRGPARRVFTGIYSLY